MANAGIKSSQAGTSLRTIMNNLTGEVKLSGKSIKKGNAKYQQRYAFSGKIICGECGNTFRRRIHSSTHGKYAAWVCNTHLEDTSRCSMLYIRDDDLKLAFTTMINKLVYCHKEDITSIKKGSVIRFCLIKLHRIRY